MPKASQTPVGPVPLLSIFFAPTGNRFVRKNVMYMLLPKLLSSSDYSSLNVDHLENAKVLLLNFIKGMVHSALV